MAAVSGRGGDGGTGRLVLSGGGAALDGGGLPGPRRPKLPDRGELRERPVLHGGVGFYFNGTAWQTLVLRWNGTRWAKVSSPDPRTTGYNELDGVSCPSASFCIAAGWYGNGTTAQDLALRWNGTRWAKVSSRTPATLPSWTG